MAGTTLIKKRGDMIRKPISKCHDGEGDLDWIGVLGGRDGGPAKRLRFLHDNILKPGVSIGVHRHEDDEEYYYILSGKGVMTLDGERFEVEAGDVTAVFPGGSHGLENNAQEDMRILVFAIR